MGAVVGSPAPPGPIRRVERGGPIRFSRVPVARLGEGACDQAKVVPHPATDSEGLAGIAGRATYGAIYRVAFVLTLPMFLVTAGRNIRLEGPGPDAPPDGNHADLAAA